MATVAKVTSNQNHHMSLLMPNDLNIRKVRALAGDLWFARGEAYFEESRVTDLSERQGKLSAIVTGTQDYRVRLWWESDEIRFRCTCPLGDDEQFCKHCVAAALAWLQAAQEDSNLPLPARESHENDLREFLERLEKDKLIEMLLREADQSRGLHERLQLEAARLKPSGVDLSAFRKSIAQATRTGGFVDYYSAPRYARRIHQVIDSIAALFADGNAAAVVELTEYALAKLEKAIGQMDDSDGHMGEILPDLQELHHQACQQAGEDPEQLARRLFAWELKSDWEIFYGAAAMYADVFGPKGLAEYQRLAETKWAHVPALGPGSDDGERYGKRFRITRMMETLASLSGDPEALVAVKCRDLSHPYSFLEIAEIYRKANRHDDALEWAEKGMRAFANVDSRLSDFLADEYHRRGRHAEAMDLIWAQFIESPGLSTYQKLQSHALWTMSDKLQFVAPAKTLVAAKGIQAGNRVVGKSHRQTELRRNSPANSDWPRWRDQALAHLRAVTESENRASDHAKTTRPTRRSADHSQLVEIFLWEQEYEAAWQEASAGGCAEYLWLRLADAIAKEHPERAMPIYKELIPPTLSQTNNTAYDEAIKLLRKMRKLMSCLDRAAEFEDYVIALRVEYKRKRNFIKLLDAF